MGVWSVSKDEGFATGPAVEVKDGDRSVLVSAVWSDEDGVCVSVDSGDEPVPARLAVKVWAAVRDLATTKAPAFSIMCAAFAGGVEIFGFSF